MKTISLRQIKAVPLKRFHCKTHDEGEEILIYLTFEKLWKFIRNTSINFQCANDVRRERFFSWFPNENKEEKLEENLSESIIRNSSLHVFTLFISIPLPHPGWSSIAGDGVEGYYHLKCQRNLFATRAADIALWMQIIKILESSENSGSRNLHFKSVCILALCVRYLTWTHCWLYRSEPQRIFENVNCFRIQIVAHNCVGRRELNKIFLYVCFLFSVGKDETRGLKFQYRRNGKSLNCRVDSPGCRNLIHGLSQFTLFFHPLRAFPSLTLQTPTLDKCKFSRFHKPQIFAQKFQFRTAATFYAIPGNDRVMNCGLHIYDGCVCVEREQKNSMNSEKETNEKKLLCRSIRKTFEPGIDLLFSLLLICSVDSSLFPHHETLGKRKRRAKRKKSLMDTHFAKEERNQRKSIHTCCFAENEITLIDRKAFMSCESFGRLMQGEMAE